MRMSVPCRASTCDHLQCFDASLYLMMNEKKPKWVCPVCNKQALYENLLIDGYFSDVLTSRRLPSDEHEIVLNSDASWDPMVVPKKTEKVLFILKYCTLKTPKETKYRTRAIISYTRL